MFFVTLILTAAFARTFGSNIAHSKLMTAIAKRDRAEVEVLINTVDIDERDFLGWNVLHKAVHYADSEMVRFLMSRGAGRLVNDQVIFQHESHTPLLLACYAMANSTLRRKYRVMEALLMAGADPNIAYSDLNTALHVVPYEAEARLLISYGADVDVKNHFGYTPALMCVHNEYYNVLRALVDGKADFSIVSDTGETVFHLMKPVFEGGNWTREFILLLAGNGAPLDVLDARGETALTKHLRKDLARDASASGNSRIEYEHLNDSFYAYMAEAGANLSAPNRYGYTMLHLAVSNYHVGMTKWLLEKGVDVNAINYLGNSPLSEFVKEERTKYGRCDRHDVVAGEFFLGMKLIKAVVDVLVENGGMIHDKVALEALNYFNNFECKKAGSTGWIRHLGKYLRY